MEQTSNYISANADVDRIIKWEGGSGNNRDSNDLPRAKVADRAPLRVADSGQLRLKPCTRHHVLHDKPAPAWKM